MANIFLTRKCNLKCSYCFADEFVNKENEEMSFEDFVKVFNFIKEEKREKIGLIGGEPTLHSQFSKILEYILANSEDDRIIVVYTNGLAIDKYIDLLSNPRVLILINCNSPKDIGMQNFEKLKANLKLLSEKKAEGLTLGINLYSSKLDYHFVFDLLKLIDSHRLRFSVALSNETKNETGNVLTYFKNIKPMLMNFFEECLNREIVPQNDCNSIPDCLLSVEEKKILLKFIPISKKYTIASPIQTAHLCNCVIDILPDLTAVRCFGFSKYLKAPISDFKSLSRLKSYFFNKIDVYARVSYLSPDCENCRSRVFEKCGVCLTYKIKQMENIKDFVLKSLNDDKE